MNSHTSARIVKLSESDLEMANPAEDVRGRTVFDAYGDPIGVVHELVIDERFRRVRFISVQTQGFVGRGNDVLLIPAEAITRVSTDSVRIDRDVDQVIAAPPCDAAEDDCEHLERLYNYYGYAPYWTEGYSYTSLPFHY